MSNHEIIVTKLYSMLEMAKELAEMREPALEGDIQIVLALVSDKLRYMDPLNYYEHVTQYE
ncbi:MAG: hypothetical protein HY675_19190 [Chloroflexi bacterium]|nr:hypothetical protein [Chloroflexota bacterium]